MTFTVEDGTGVDGANSYVTIADADTYFVDRGNTTWSGKTNAEKQVALILATDYLVQAYRLLWKGTKVEADQALDWPRDDVYRADFDTVEIAATVVPIEVKTATYELAIRQIELGADSDDRLNPDLDRGGAIKMVKAGSVAVEYFDGANPETVRSAVDDILRPLLDAASGGVGRSLLRA